MDPLSIAKNLIRVYVKRGDDIGDLNRSQMGGGCKEYSAHILRNKIWVTKVNGKEINESFPLERIYKLIKNEEVQPSLF